MKNKKKGPSASKLQLMKTSDLVKALAIAGDKRFLHCTGVNSMLLVYYGLTEETELKTYRAWKLAGYQVQKGAQSFKIWARKRKATEKTAEQIEEFDPAEVQPEGKKYEFYGVCALFSKDQVKPIEKKACGS